MLTVINATQSRLDLEDLELWRNVGLHIDENGLLVQQTPLNISSSLDNEDYDADVDGSVVIEEDVVSNGLVWLLSRIVNFITAGDGLSPGDFELPAGSRNQTAVAQEDLLKRWKRLELELQTWHEHLPPTFAPCLRANMPSTNSTPDSCSKVWYSIPMCAATVQCYHMARILLLMNKPQESTAIRSTVTARMRSYRLIQQEVLYHSREIYGISLCSLPDAVRLHSLQPLFVAGQCLSEQSERQIILDLLLNVERDLGWATDYRIQQLLREWEVERMQESSAPSELADQRRLLRNSPTY